LLGTFSVNYNYVFAVRQGWTKFYEFGWSDLRSSAEVIDGLYARAGITSVCERTMLFAGHNNLILSPILGYICM